MHQASIAEQAKALARGDYSSVELTQHYLKRIEKYDSKLNSYVSLSHTGSMAQATEADTRIAAGHAGPLTGIPISLKDIICMKSSRTTCGSKMLDNFISPYTATLAQQLLDAGCVVLGKTNMDEFAMGSSTETSFYGPTKNPWHTEYAPGGSSGGSAAAVAARLCAASIGTDTGGSIRQPAAFCGLTGLKPTYGRVSRYGVVAFASSLDQAGPMAASAEDVAFILQAITGHDAKDSTSLTEAVPNFSANLKQPLDGLKVGIPTELFGDGIDAKTTKLVNDAIKELEQLGATVAEVSLPHAPAAIDAYYVIAPAEASSNLSRFDGVRYGYRCASPKSLEDLYTRSRSEGFGEEVKRRLLVGTYALSSGYYDAYYIKAQQVRTLVSRDFQHAFAKVDVIVSPTSPAPAFKLGSKLDDPLSMYLSDVNTVAVNLAGLPALSMPVGFSNGLPVGMQIIGPHLAESKLLQVAHQYQQVTDWHKQIPEAFA